MSNSSHERESDRDGGRVLAGGVQREEREESGSPDVDIEGLSGGIEKREKRVI